MKKRNIFQRILGRMGIEWRKFFFPYWKSYSQCGEDMLLRYYFPQPNGFYVDIGAFDPRKISNTYHFFQKGWRGINVDGNEVAIAQFKRYRPNDISVFSCVGNVSQPQHVPFFKFYDPALNTFKADELPRIKKYHQLDPIETVEVPLCSLTHLLDKYVPAGQTIDFISIDVEGADFDVLQSNDWVKYRPKAVLIESHQNFESMLSSDLYLYLKDRDFAIGGVARHTYLFVDRRSFPV
jgi:FkbM family methyltransferase